MPQEAVQGMTLAMSSVIIASPPHNFGTFFSTDSVDIEDLLNMFEQVSTCNWWDQALKLANVIYLEGTA